MIINVLGIKILLAIIWNINALKLFLNKGYWQNERQWLWFVYQIIKIKGMIPMVLNEIECIFRIVIL